MPRSTPKILVWQVWSGARESAFLWSPSDDGLMMILMLLIVDYTLSSSTAVPGPLFLKEAKLSVSTGTKWKTWTS